MFSRRAGRFGAALALAGMVGCGGGADAGDSDPAAEESAEVVDEMGAETADVGLLNPNLATAEQLASVAGEGAAALVEGRPWLAGADLHGALAAAVGEDAATAAYDALWLPIDLNDASREDILRIPGVGDRMAHEFEEYRPYADMDQFRREIGKYVDADEVARLERYVYLRLDLNAATRDEIMAVPGMTERMAHEFEEYRPYGDLEQFRREIGKYVDEGEVARLERYVSLN